MRYSTTIVLSACLFAATPAALSADQPLDCSKKSLATAVADFRDKDPVIMFTGVCAGPIVIRADGVTLQGVGEAIIDGGGAGRRHRCRRRPRLAGRHRSPQRLERHRRGQRRSPVAEPN